MPQTEKKQISPAWRLELPHTVTFFIQGLASFSVPLIQTSQYQSPFKMSNSFVGITIVQRFPVQISSRNLGAFYLLNSPENGRYPSHRSCFSFAKGTSDGLCAISTCLKLPAMYDDALRGKDYVVRMKRPIPLLCPENA